MDEKEILLQDITAKVKKELELFASKSDLETALKTNLNEMTEKFSGVAELQKSMDVLKKAAEKQGEAIELMKTSAPVKEESVKMQLEKNHDAIKRMLSGDMTAKTTIIPTAITSNFNGVVIPGIGQLQTRQPVIQSLFAQSGIGGNNQRTIRYMDQVTNTNNAASRTVGNAAAEGVMEWQGYNLNIESITQMIPVALEMVENFDFIQSEINNNLLKNMDLAVENLVLNGTGNTPQIKGLDVSATAFAATDTKIKTPSILDLIAYAATVIGNNSAYRANYVLMNNFDALALKLEKDTLGRPLYPNFMSADGMNIDGIRIIATPLVPADTMYIGDFSFGTFYNSGVQITMGLNADDFSKRKVTMLANTQCALLIKALNTAAFVKSTISTDLAAITKAGN